MSAETLALCDVIDDAIFLQHIISNLLLNNSVKIPINVYTDNWSLFDALPSTRNVTEKKLHIGIAVAIENIENKNVNTYPVNNNQQLTNVLTKGQVYSDLLLKTIRSCIFLVVN